MKFLKGVALSFLSFLLFLSLSIFGLALTLNYTILDPDFIVSEVDRLDIASLSTDLITPQLPQELEGRQFVTEALDNTITDLEPWIKEQASIATYTSYDYLMGRSQSLSLVISLEPVRESLRDNLWQAFQKSPPPELAGVPPDKIEPYFDEYYQQFSQDIPSTFEFTEGSLPPETLAILEQVRQAIGYFQLGYKALIGFMVVLILGIVFIDRQVRGSTRRLGTTFLTYGAVEYGGIFAAKYLTEMQMAQFDIPSSLQAWLPQFYDNFLAPLEIFSLGLLIGGVVLLVVSFVYKPRQPASEL